MANIRPSYNTDRTILGEKLPLDTPFSIILDVSERCNFRCSYCFRSGIKNETWGFASNNEVMTSEIFERAVRQLALFPRKIKQISLSGHGEPLCNPNLANMVRILKQLDVAEKIDMHTNGALLTEKSAISIAQSGFSRIIVSLQGLDADAYKRTCQVKINFDKFYNNLKIMYENKNNDLKIHIKVADVALGKEKLKAEENRFTDLFENIADSVSVEKIVPLWSNLDIVNSTAINKFGYEYGDVKYCSLVFYKLMVAPNGEIYPCTKLPPPISLGNIQDNTLVEAWNSPARLNFLRNHLRLTRHNHNSCSGCFIPVNSIASEDDVIDLYSQEVLERLERCDTK